MKKGFTLIEVIVSIALMAILVTVIAALNLSIMRINSSSRDRDNSFNIARGICEIFKGEDINVNALNGTGVYKYIDGLSEVTSIGDVFYTKDGDYSEGDEVLNTSEKGYTLILELSGNSSPGLPGVLEPQLAVLKVTVIKKGPLKNTVTLRAGK